MPLLYLKFHKTLMQQFVTLRIRRMNAQFLEKKKQKSKGEVSRKEKVEHSTM